MPDVGNLPVHISYTGGMGDLAAMLSNQPIDVKGTVRGTIKIVVLSRCVSLILL